MPAGPSAAQQAGDQSAPGQAAASQSRIAAEDEELFLEDDDDEDEDLDELEAGIKSTHLQDGED